MKYNKDGSVDKYYDLDSILKLNLSKNVLNIFEECFNKKVYWDNDGSCRIGKLIGIEVNHKLSMFYYIVESNNNKFYIPVWKSITKL